MIVFIILLAINLFIMIANGKGHDTFDYEGVKRHMKNCEEKWNQQNKSDNEHKF
jgi:hypothetical protein